MFIMNDTITHQSVNQRMTQASLSEFCYKITTIATNLCPTNRLRGLSLEAGLPLRISVRPNLGAKLIIWFAWRGRVRNLPTEWNDFVVFCRVKAIFSLFKYFSLKHENSSTDKVPPSGNQVISHWNQQRHSTEYLVNVRDHPQNT